MKRSHQLAVGIAAALGLGLGAAGVIAQPGGMGGGMGPQMKGGMHARGDTGHGPMSQQQLLTPEERSAFQERMRNAKTPEERRKLAEANHAEIEKRAKEKGIALPHKP